MPLTPMGQTRLQISLLILHRLYSRPMMSGLTIVAVGDIDTDTTIAAFVNATTVTLSLTLLTTATCGITFVRLNRFLPSGRRHCNKCWG